MYNMLETFQVGDESITFILVQILMWTIDSSPYPVKIKKASELKYSNSITSKKVNVPD